MHFFNIDEFMCIELFILFHYLFCGCEVVSDTLFKNFLLLVIHIFLFFFFSLTRDLSID